jgi:anaerobic ribonucleoside-triphosphate reductase activating protein
MAKKPLIVFNENSDAALRIHQFLPHSRANGPGARAAIWVQGCSLGCPGCFNPETHSFVGGQLISVDELFHRIKGLGDSIEGITISGGEPLQQHRPLIEFLLRVRKETALSVLVFTGYTWEETLRKPFAEAFLSCIDILISGRYDQSSRIARDLRGSENKTVHFLTDRYAIEDLQSVPHAEAVITVDGDVVLSGIDPLKH